MTLVRQANLLQEALAMASHGWHVFPCAVNGKQPALRGNWQDHATTDPAQVRNWWASRPYNIGLACGPSGLVVVDLDVPKEPGPATGAEALASLCAGARQPCPWSTFTVSTPSGGQHLYFQAPAHPISNSAGRLAPHIDIRANGGYVVAPGSRISGRAYARHNNGRPMPLPDWLAARLRPQPPPPSVRREVPHIGSTTSRDTAYAMAALRDETDRVAAAVDGTRHDTLNRAAFSLGQLVGSGLLPEVAVATSLADAARQSGLPERDIPRIIHSGMTAGARYPRVPRQDPPQRARPRRPQLPRDGPPRPPCPRMAL
jgi:hypothetical protein